jgi:hypothetical protein
MPATIYYASMPLRDTRQARVLRCAAAKRDSGAFTQMRWRYTLDYYFLSMILL